MLTIFVGDKVKLTLADRYAIIQKLETDESYRQSDAAKEYGLSHAAIYQMLKRRERIIEEFEKGFNPNLRRVSGIQGKSQIFDDRLLEFVNRECKRSPNISCPMVWEKAGQLATELGLLERNDTGPGPWKPNRGWWSRFKKRIGLDSFTSQSDGFSGSDYLDFEDNDDDPLATGPRTPHAEAALAMHAPITDIANLRGRGRGRPRGGGSARAEGEEVDDEEDDDAGGGAGGDELDVDGRARVQPHVPCEVHQPNTRLGTMHEAVDPMSTLPPVPSIFSITDAFLALHRLEDFANTNGMHRTLSSIREIQQCLEVELMLLPQLPPPRPISSGPSSPLQPSQSTSLPGGAHLSISSNSI